MRQRRTRRYWSRMSLWWLWSPEAWQKHRILFPNLWFYTVYPEDHTGWRIDDLGGCCHRPSSGWLKAHPCWPPSCLGCSLEWWNRSSLSWALTCQWHPRYNLRLPRRRCLMSLPRHLPWFHLRLRSKWSHRILAFLGHSRILPKAIRRSCYFSTAARYLLGWLKGWSLFLNALSSTL